MCWCGPEKAFVSRSHLKASLPGTILREVSLVELGRQCAVLQPDPLAFFNMEEELSEILGHKVELHTPQFLSRYFRDTVMADAEIQYVAPL